MIDTDESSFDQNVQGEVPVLVDFWAPWCGPCRALLPHIEKIEEEYGDRLKIVKVNIEDWPAISARFNVRSIPTLILFSNGEEQGRVTGPTPGRLKVSVEQWFSELGLDAQGTAALSEVDAPKQKSQEWRRFSGDEAVKAACLSRWENAKVPSISNAPALILPGDGADFQDVVGVPAALGAILDMMWILQDSSDPSTLDLVHQQITHVVRAIPVGVDTGSVPFAFLYDFVYNSQWNIPHYLNDETAVDLLAQVRALHDRERADQAVPEAEWERLQREAILLDQADDGGRASQALEELAHPLCQQPAMLISKVVDMAIRDFDVYPDWSREDGALIVTANRDDFDAVREKLGDRPKNPAETERWSNLVDEQMRQARQNRRLAEPELWRRYDAWLVFRMKVRLNIVRHIADDLISRLSLLGK